MFNRLWQIIRALHSSYMASRARTELHELSDRTLKDIGLTRGQINSMFR